MLILSAEEKAGATKERTSDCCMCKEKLGISGCTDTSTVSQRKQEKGCFMFSLLPGWVGLSAC